MCLILNTLNVYLGNKEDTHLIFKVYKILIYYSCESRVEPTSGFLSYFVNFPWVTPMAIVVKSLQDEEMSKGH